MSVKLIVSNPLFKGGYSSIGRTTVCGTVSFLFKSEYPPVWFLNLLLWVSNAISIWWNKSILFSIVAIKSLFYGIVFIILIYSLNLYTISNYILVAFFRLRGEIVILYKL